MLFKLFRPKIFFVLVIIFLAIMPFFWIPVGTMDLGGDSSRLYFYNPLAYLKNFSFYGLIPEGIGGVSPNYYFLPFLLLLIGLRTFLSPYLLITLFNSMELVIAFLSMYGILSVLISHKIKKEFSQWASLLGGLFYVLSPKMIGNWDKALLSHNQVFLNPLMFFLLLKFFLTKKIRFAIFFLFISVVFAPNFGFTSAPPIFSFYPLAMVFLVVYIIYIRREQIPWKSTLLLLFSFLGLHAFHLIPQIRDLFSPGSFANTRVFDRTSIAQEGVRYFFGVLPLAKVSTDILLPPYDQLFVWFSFTIPFFAIIGLVFFKKGQKTLLLTTFFFLITLFLLGANITNVGIFLYQNLFYIPGFSMFRNFIGQWPSVFSFFYALLFGQSLAFLFIRLQKKIVIVCIVWILFVLIFSSWQLINGSLVNQFALTTPKRQIAMTMDPNFIRSMDDIQMLPEGKVLLLPFSDSFYELVPGANNGVYISSSMLSYLSGRSSFSGYQVLEPFSEKFLQLSRNKDYEGIQKLLGVLNIKYILYNSNSILYDKITPDYYQYVRQYLPANQFLYKEFIGHLNAQLISTFGDYSIYVLPDTNFLPKFFIADASCYIQNNGCDSPQKKQMLFHIEEHDPTFYTIHVESQNTPFVLIFSNAFHSDWELYNDKGPIKIHFLVNQYANGWYIIPKDFKDKKFITLDLSLKEQKIFYVSLGISSVFLLGLLLFFVTMVFRGGNYYNKKHD